MTHDWEVATETLTEGEVLEYYLDGNEIVLSSNLAKNEIHLTSRQATDLICGLSLLITNARRLGG